MARRTVYTNRDGYRHELITDRLDPGTVMSYAEQDLDPVLSSIQAFKDHLSSNPERDIRTVARIPKIIYNQMVREGWDDDDMRKWLNDPANKCFRIWEGQV